MSDATKKVVEYVEQVKRERDEARAEVEKLRATLVSKHGGEPLALLAELDAARAEVERLRGRLDTAVHAEAKLRADILRGLKVANALTLETQSVTDMATDLVRMVHEARLQRDRAEALVEDKDRERLRENIAVKLLDGPRNCEVCGMSSYEKVLFSVPGKLNAWCCEACNKARLR